MNFSDIYPVKSFFRFFIFILVVYVLLASVISLLTTESVSIQACADQFRVINANNDRLHERDWQLIDYSHSFCTSYESSEAISLASGEKRNDLIANADSYENFWGTIYSKLVKDSQTHIDFLVDSLSSIALMEELSRTELAELIVTFVQDIPYSYVRVEDCSEANNQGKPCIGHIALGLLSPYEFLHSLYGDCDTRAVLIYAMLEKLGYDPMIVVSNEYAHAMIALNIPARGDHLRYRGKNYYFWETTGKGWPIGMLPPNSNNINYWKIALVNER
ncbi:hypothetical protein [Ekhidna sp.]|uniref:hypothetical protein n=1 Tax=Ekhidna sp. TaxID=2608089 RepID=UPI003B59B8E3